MGGLDKGGYAMGSATAAAWARVQAAEVKAVEEGKIAASEEAKAAWKAVVEAELKEAKAFQSRRES